MVVPPAALAHPAGHHVAARVETVQLAADTHRRRRRVRAVGIAPPPAQRIRDPLAGHGLVRILAARGDREGRGGGHVVVGARIRVAARGLDPNGLLPRQSRDVHVVRPQRHDVARGSTGRNLAAAHQHSRRGHGPAHRRAHRDGTGELLAVQRRPRRPIPRVLDLADHGPGLVFEDGVESVQEATAAILLAVPGRVQLPVVARRLRLHEVDNLRARVLGVHRLDERGDTRHVRRRHGRAVGDRVAAQVEQQRRGRINLVAGRREVNRRAVVRKIGARQGQAGGHVVGLGDGAHLRNAVDHGGHADTALDGAALGRRGGICGRTVIDRGVVDAHPLVTGSGDDRQAPALRVVNRARRRLQARRLLRVRRAPVDPRIHRVGVVHDVHPVIGRPHERAGHVLGVDEAVIVRGLDGHNRRLGRDAVNADVVVVGGDDARDVCAVVELVAPAVEVLRSDAIHRALHGALSVHAAFQVGVRVLDARVHDGDGHGGAFHGHGPCLARVHGLGTPVEDSLLGAGLGLGRGLVAREGQAAGGSSVVARNVVAPSVVARGGVLAGGEGDALVVEDALGAGRADRVDGDARVLEGRGQVGRERGRGALCEESADLRVGGQGGALDRRNQREGALEVLGADSRRQVDGVVHLVVVGAGGGDEARCGFVGAGRRGLRRHDAHGQGEGGDDSDACDSAAHCSSAFDRCWIVGTPIIYEFVSNNKT